MFNTPKQTLNLTVAALCIPETMLLVCSKQESVQ